VATTLSAPRPPATRPEVLDPLRRQSFSRAVGPKLGSFWQTRIFCPHPSALRFSAALRRLVSAQRSYRSIDAKCLRAFALAGRPSIGSVFSHCWARISWICASSSWAQAKCCAAICCSSVAGAPAKCANDGMIFSTANGSGCPGRDRPCRKALRLDFCFPAAVLGPVLRFALARFAAICFSVANGSSSCVLTLPTRPSRPAGLYRYS
jgi:hypothetical protein